MLSLYDPFELILDRPSAQRWRNLATTANVRPKLDYTMDVKDDVFVITVDVPGVSREDLEIEYADGKLVFSAKRGDTVKTLSIAVNDDFDFDNPEAVLERGVLTLRVDKRPEKRPRKIQIEVRE